MAEEYRTTREVAEYFRTSEETVRYWKHIGKIKGIRPGRRNLFPISEIERLEREAASSGPESA
ncbi:helix-turn-helix domain-containing protein [Actinomadura sp. BRA 177]|uniref:helix-turn-helix domain-containing protein n=1 Tax=Actinomadura sp. BRA 177 TaxID=2745202 RepID=UPI00281504F3|nr:helix-turn-helix domain-containing protein [Actinomadura sp. BRA 177]